MRRNRVGAVETWGFFLGLVFVGSALGGFLRYGVSDWAGRLLGGGFPIGTMVVNVTGAFAVGFVWAFAWPDLLGIPGRHLQIFLLFGFLGGYTTVSSYALQSLALLREGARMRAVVNLLGTFILCLAAVFGGAWMAGGSPSLP